MVLGTDETSLIELNLAASKAVFTYGESICESICESIFEECSYLTRQAIMAKERLAGMN